MKNTVQTENHGEIVYEEGFWTGKRTVSINGAPLEKISKTEFRTADGVSVVAKGNFLSGVKLDIGGELISVVPTVKWYEIVLSILPFLLIMVWGNVAALCRIVPVIGGAIGGAISGLMSVLNLVIIKRTTPIWLKIIISLAMLAATFGICCGLGYAIVSALS